MTSSSRSIRFSSEAKADLADIAQFTFQVWGTPQQESYAQLLDAGLERIRDFPEIGKARIGRHFDFRGYRVGQHMIIYRLSGNIVEVMRIVHVRMDLKNIELSNELD